MFNNLEQHFIDHIQLLMLNYESLAIKEAFEAALKEVAPNTGRWYGYDRDGIRLV